MSDWDIEERIEDSFVSYLQPVLSNARVYSAWKFEKLQYPAVICHTSSQRPIADAGGWYIHREFDVSVMVISEASPEIEGGVELRTAREQNQAHRSAVVKRLSCEDLHDSLNEFSGQGVNFSMAYIDEVERSEEDRRLITAIDLSVIANPKQLEYVI